LCAGIGAVFSREPREGILALWLLAPAMVAMGAVAVVPLAQSLWMSLHRVELAFPGPRPFVGLQNYLTAVQSPEFWKSAGVTVYFTVASVALELGAGLLGAVLLNEEFRGRQLLRSLVLIPWAMLTLSTALMWFWIYNPTYGILNALLVRLGVVDAPVVWLGDPLWAMPAVIVADAWKTTPFMTLLLLAGLQPIPWTLYEAAAVDGASRWQIFRYVVLPLLRPALLVAVILRSLQAFKVFDMIFVLTAGGPADATRVLAVYTYQQAFRYFHVGYGSALAWLITLATLVMVVLYLRALQASAATEEIA
jgi:ABC-type sugar transport system permease subunit